MTRAPILLAVALLAGCTAPLGGGTFTAKEAQGQADPAARAWRADAVLQGIIGPEGGPGSPFLGNGSMGRGEWYGGEPRPDPHVGDGRLPQWYLQYFSASAQRSLGVWVYADGTVAPRERPPEGGDRPLGEWTVDSAQAASLAMQDANFSRGARATDGGAAYILGPGGDGGQPVWILTAGSESAMAGGIVFIDARTGERRPVPALPGFPMGLPGFFGGDAGGNQTGCRPTASASQGSVDLRAPEAEHPFDVGPDCRTLQLTLTWTGRLPTDRVAVAVEDPAGRALAAEQEQAEAGSYAAVFAAGGPGTYVARVTLAAEQPAPAAVGADYDLTVAVGA